MTEHVWEELQRVDIFSHEGNHQMSEFFLPQLAVGLRMSTVSFEYPKMGQLMHQCPEETTSVYAQVHADTMESCRIRLSVISNTSLPWATQTQFYVVE